MALRSFLVALLPLLGPCIYNLPICAPLVPCKLREVIFARSLSQESESSLSSWHIRRRSNHLVCRLVHLWPIVRIRFFMPIMPLYILPQRDLERWLASILLPFAEGTGVPHHFPY